MPEAAPRSRLERMLARLMTQKACLEFARADLRNNEVTLHTELAIDLPPIRVDGIQIDQVLMNLIRNAVEAMRETEGGPRDLTIRSRRAGEDYIEIVVEDTGPGLAPKAANKVFDAFYTTKTEGMGMGLAIGRTIIEAHGGRLWAESDPGRGTSFRFTLPIHGRPD